MRIPTKNFRPKLLAACVSAALLGSYSSAYGVVISTTANATVGAVSDNQSQTKTDSTAISSASVSPFGGYSNASSYTFGKDYGAFAVSNSAIGANASADGSVQYVRNVSNTTSSALHFTYTFYIYGGYLVTSVAQALTGLETLGAYYDAVVTYGGSTIWSSHASVQNAASGATESFSGTSLGVDGTADGTYSWSGQSFVLDLGVLDPGTERELVTTLSGGSNANVGAYSYCGSGYGYYGGGCQDTAKGSSRVFYGDPDGLEGRPRQGQATEISAVEEPTSPNDVPEPGTLLLLGAAALAATMTRRKTSE